MFLAQGLPVPEPALSVAIGAGRRRHLDTDVLSRGRTIRHRVQRLQVRHGLGPVDDATGRRLAEGSPVLAGIVGASVQQRVALGQRAGARCGGSAPGATRRP
jgi:hypothetical protein